MTSNGSVKESPKKDVAVYIDYENLYISLRSTVGANPQFDVILDKCREFGRVTIGRAYADWSEFARVVTSQMFSSGVEPIYVPTRKFYDAKTRSQATKNSVDIHITIDIIKDVLSTKNIDIFVLVSGDRDFVPLMNQIRAAGKEVYAIGVAGCTSAELAVAVDEMFYYHQLLENEDELAAEQRDIYAKLVRAIEIARARGYRTTLGVIKPIMREVVVGFDERKFRNAKGVPFQQFKQFVTEAERNGFVKVLDSGGAIELGLPGEDANRVRAKLEEEREAQRSRAPARPSTAAPRAASSEAEDDEDEDAAVPAGGRRRGRRGGRRRRRPGSADGEAMSVRPGEDAGNGHDHDHEEDEDGPERSERSDRAERIERPDRAERVERPDRAERVERPDRPERVERPERPERFQADRPAAPREDDEDAHPAAPVRRRTEEAPARTPARRPPAVAADDDEGDDEWNEADVRVPADMVLPTGWLEDVKAMLETFGGRAPSQRRLIARLKKGAASGELQGTYQEGQFLLMVRKAMQDHHVEKVSKGFYSGLKWKDAGETAAAS